MGKQIPTNPHVPSRPVQPAVRPPVVAVLGHVDHGKTTLLDTIRKTNVAGREHGGITQHIGAYQIVVFPKNAKGKAEEKRLLTFIDTPGHEAFAKIRSRGAQAADIALLVVAADDSVKPQTIESIEQIKLAGIPMIVVINKIDVPGALVDKVKSDLAKVGVQVEGFGGDVPCVSVSAKNGSGVDALLELIFLVADMKGLSADVKGVLSAIVIEAKVDKFRGIVATVLVKNGTMTSKSLLYEASKPICRVRAMTDESGARIQEALPGKPVEVLGCSTLPSIGVELSGEPYSIQQDVKEGPLQSGETSAADFLAAMTEADKKKLNIFLKADTSGSLEAVAEALSNAETVIVRTGIGDITEADILDAKAMDAIVVGFNVKAGNGIDKLARVEKVIYRTYTIIYKLLEEMRDVVDGMEELLSKERELGQGKIIAEFPFDNDRIAGTKVVSGRLAKGDSVKIIRGEEELVRVRIKSIRQGKNEVTKAIAGIECGVLFDKKVDFMLQDAIIAYTTG